MLLPSESDARIALGVVQAAFAPVGGLDELQHAVLGSLASSLYSLDLDDILPAGASEIDAANAAVRRQAVHLMVVVEFVEHHLRPEVSDRVEQFARELGVSLSLLRDARHLARGHFAAMYLDLQRHSWYEEETIRESLQGRWHELIRSKVAYEGGVADRAIARRWCGLRECVPGTWGRAVADFYDDHGFPFPGERHGIYELGARHDWIHVLAGYGTSPEGELDVFAFIGASMADERGLVLLAITLGLFQNGAIRHMAGKRVVIARADTLSDPGAISRFTEAMRRGHVCPTDVMGTVDLFSCKDESLAAARERLGVIPAQY